MSGAAQVAIKLTKAFPGLRVTSVKRTQAEQDALVKAGKTRSRNSQHLDGNGLDVVLPKGVTSAQVRKFLSDNGHNPGEFINESGKGQNQGTGEHLHIGLAPKGGDQSSGGGGSTYDRIKARQSATEAPSIAGAYQSYQNGEMSPQEAAQFENAVISGHVILPRGAKINKAAPVPTLPVELINAYNSHAMDDDPEARAEIDRAVHAGEVGLPRGMTLKAPKARSFGENFGMGTRNVMTGAGGLLDLGANAVNGVINAATGTQLSADPFRNLANAGADALGLAKPESGTEKLLAAGTEGATQGLATFGIGSLASGAGGVGGSVARSVAANPMIDTLSGATSGVSQETARQAGAGPVGQLAAGLVGGFAPVGVAGSLERAAARPRTIAEVAEQTPRSAVIDETGNLTPHGQEVAARHGATPEQVVQAYEAPPSAKARVANDEASPALAREATNDQPVMAPNEQAPPTRPVEQASPSPVAEQPAAPVAEPLPGEASARLADAQDQGFTLSRGQATKNFDVQDAEQRLRNSNGPQAEEARAFFAKQAEDIKGAVTRFKDAFAEEIPSAQRGEIVRDALSELRDNGAEGVKQLYAQARELGAPVGIDSGKIKNTIEGVLVEADVPESVKNVIQQEAARYGLIGKPEVIDATTGKVTNEAGITTVKLDDGQRIKFRGEPQTLRLDNAEDFRKVISKQYVTDGPLKYSQEIKRAIDDAVEETAANLATEGKGSVGKAMEKARAAHVEQVQTFRSKDVVQDIIDWKKGTGTAKLSPEQVMQRALGKESDLARLKTILLTKPTVNSQAAWRGIQAHGLAQLFQKATQANANIGGQVMDAISGAKLRSAMSPDGPFPPSKLKILLDIEDFDKLMKLRRSIEDATIPVSGTTNPSGSGNLIMRLMNDVDNKVTGAFAAAGYTIGGPVGGAVGATVGRTVSPAIKAVKEAKQAQETLSGIKDYSPAQAVSDTGEKAPSAMASAGSAAKQAAAKTVGEFIEIYSSPRVIAPVLAASSGEDE